MQLADSLVECLGAGDVAPGVIRPAAPPFEVVLRVTVRDPDRAAVERFCRELAPLITSGPPGLAGYAAGRPSPRPAFGYWPRSCRAAWRRIAHASTFERPRSGPCRPRLRRRSELSGPITLDRSRQCQNRRRWIRLGELAHTRSGDKGDRSNIGVVALDAAAYQWLVTHLTVPAVADFLRPMGIGEVTRFEIPGLHSFNFVVDHALAGGASRSLRLDTQGKALGVVLLELKIPSPVAHSPTDSEVFAP